MTVAPLAGVAGVGALGRLAGPVTAALPSPTASSFPQMLLDGIGAVDRKLAAADAQVRAFALDDSIPVHQVTYALEQARLSVELMVQVRSRLVEGIQQFMTMQL